MATTEDERATEGTVKGLAWKILYGNHRPVLGPERWAHIVQEVGGPADVKRLSLDTDVPVGPFNDALDLLDQALGQGDGAKLAEMGQSAVDRWATMYRTLVEQMQGRPGPMLEILCSEVHPWLVDADQGAHIVERDETSAILEVSDGLHPGFREGLVLGFARITGVDASIERLGEDRYQVRWAEVRPERPARLRVVLEAMRAPFLGATLAPVLVGTALAAAGGLFDATRLTMAALAAIALHAAANMLNDVLDHKRGIDEANLTPTPLAGGSRVIQRELVGWRRMAAGAGALAIAGIGLGLALAWLTGPSILVLGALGVAVGYAYTGEPFRLAHRSLGELAVLVVFGPLLTAGGYAIQTGNVTLQALAAGLPLGMLMAGIVSLNELPDAPWDARTGKRTLVVRLQDGAPALTAALLLAPFPVIAVLTWLGALPAGALLALIPLPAAVLQARGIVRAGFDADALVGPQRSTLVLHAVTGLLLALGTAQAVIL